MINMLSNDIEKQKISESQFESMETWDMVRVWPGSTYLDS
jgi:hypothetical protein